MKTRVLALSIILLTSTKCNAVDAVDHLERFNKSAEALKQDMAAMFDLIDSTIKAKTADIENKLKELADFEASVRTAHRQRREAITAIFNTIKPLEERFMFIQPDKKDMWAKALSLTTATKLPEAITEQSK